MRAIRGIEKTLVGNEKKHILRVDSDVWRCHSASGLGRIVRRGTDK